MNPKQVLVWNKALKVRKGKFAAQLSHAAVASFLASGRKNIYSKYTMMTFATEDPNAVEWISTKFRKIVVSVENEEQLLELHERVKAAGLPCALITDAGDTEFHGVPTVTCLGIGPGDNDAIDEFTRHLPLM